MFGRRFIVSCVHTAASAIILISLYTNIPVFAAYYGKLANVLLYLLFIWIAFPLSRRLLLGGKIKTKNKAVFITGCDTGFGNNLAKRLDSKGFQVFASCLFPDGPGAVELKVACSDKLQILHLDVTKEESVEKAVHFVKQNLGASKLWALVNNAGIYKGWMIEFTSIDVFRENIEVNTIGTVRVAKAFLPLIRESKGRVINVTSLGGRISLPLICSYVMSKHATAAFTECLSEEMSVWGVQVISIEPEIFRTELFNTDTIASTFDKGLKKLDEDTLNSYGDEYFKKLKLVLHKFSKCNSSKINIVIDDLESAVMDKYPRYVYKPRWNILTRMAWDIFQNLPFRHQEVVTLFVNKFFFGMPTPNNAT